MFLLLALGVAVSPVSAWETAKWLPAEMDLILTFNVRQFLQDHKNTDAVQGLLEPWRLAVRGDEKELRQYYRTHDLLKSAGDDEQDFLHRARMLRSFSDGLGLNPLEDVDRVTCGFQKGKTDTWAVLVEGRFQQEKLRAAVRNLANQYAASFEVLRTGGLELWQVSGNADGVCLVLLNSRTLAITSRRGPMDDLVLRASDKKDGLRVPKERVLLEKAQKEHVAFFMDHIDDVRNAAVKSWIDEMALALNLRDNAFGKLVLGQVAPWVLKNGDDISCVSVGLSVGMKDSSLQIGLMTKKPQTSKNLATQIDRGKFLAALTAKAINDKLMQQLGDILLQTRVTVPDAAVVVHARIPHEFLQEVALASMTTLHPLVEQLGRRITSIPLWEPPGPPAPGAMEVQEVRDVAYRDGASADPIRHRLDLFLPRGKKGFPVVVLIHGGNWIMGDNRSCGLYSSVGYFLASQGIGAVLPNYRLSPLVVHPEHIKDVARAVRWTRDHIAPYGGNPERIFLLGHSAGGHLVSLLATDATYLKAEGLSSHDLKGIISFSGVYRISPGSMEVFLGGPGSRSFRLDQVYPLRSETGRLPVLPPLGVAIKVDPFGPAFGNDPKGRTDASPVSHVHRGLPPFLILVGDQDLPTLQDMAEEFHKALLREGCTSRLLLVKNRNHNSLLFSAVRPEDPAARAILEFLR